MLRILFWNTAKNPMRHHLAELCKDLSPDVVIVAECADNEMVFSGELTAATKRVYTHPHKYAGRIEIATTLPRGMITPVFDDNLV